MEQEIVLRQPSTRGLRELLTILFKHRRKILIIFSSIVLTVLILSFCRAPIYEGRSSVLVKIGREYLNNPGVGDNKAIMSLNQEEVINSEIEILTQPDLIRRVIATLKLERIYPDLASSGGGGVEAGVAAFRRGLNVEGIKKSNVILVSFQHKDPQIAAQAVNLLVQYYTDKHLQVFSDPKSSFLEHQLTAYEKKLNESEKALRNFKQKNNVFSLDEQRTLLLKQRTELDTSYLYAQNAVQELKRKVATLSGQMQSVSKNDIYSNSQLDSVIVQAKNNLLSLQLKEQELRKKYPEDSPLVVGVGKDIEMVRKFLKEQESDISNKVRGGNAVYQSVKIELVKAKSELSSQMAKAASLEEQLTQIDRDIRALDANEMDTLKLKREQAVDEKNYQSYRERTEASRISGSMNRLQLADISVIQKATVPLKPVKPKKVLNLILATVLGGLFALGIAFFSEYTSQSYSFPDDAAARLGIPVLATVTYADNGWN